MPPRYHPEILAALAGHGIVPREETGPQFLRDAVRDLYKYEIRRLRGELLAGRVRKADYAGCVIQLRKRYWILSVPVDLWLITPSQDPDRS
ncbi:MAG TPA: hypothetical protein VFK20_14630 [Vicinamibacterales bacterium]|nr:hypothetical protein [Vicinamibacterales bacterium]